MPDLPVVSGDEFIRLIRSLGYEAVRSRESHVRLRAAGRVPLSVPRHRELDRGLLRSLIRDAGITVDEFVALLRR